MDIKKIPLHHLHEQLGGKMVEFAGFWMPVRYTSDKDEHLAVRNSVGVFDVSHMGEFILKGPKALDLIQKIVSNDASKLFIGKVMYGYFPNSEGGIVDDLLVYRLGDEEYMLVVNASNIEKDWNWIVQHNTEGATMDNISEDTCLFAVQGPKAHLALQKLTSVDLESMEYYTFQKRAFAGVPDVLISATGYTGAGGFELYVPAQHAENIWNAIFEAGREFDIKPIGLGARDTLRLEKGFCLYGNDIDDTTSPLEAGLGWVTKFTKKFINSDVLQRQKEEGLKRKLVAFKMTEKGAIPRSHYEILDQQNQPIGIVTSGTLSPSLNIGIGMGYVAIAHSKPGSILYISIRNKTQPAEVVKLPFV